MKITELGNGRYHVRASVPIPTSWALRLLKDFEEYPKIKGVDKESGVAFLECKINPFIILRIEETNSEGLELVSSLIYDFIVPSTIKDGEEN